MALQVALKVVESLVDVFVVAGIAWPYIPQAKAILRTRDASGFSAKVSLVIIASCVLRIFYWLAQPAEEKYALPLLIQAFVGVAAQMAMMHVLVKVGNDPAPPGAGVAQRPRRTADRNFLDFRAADFWRWTDWASYAMAVTTFNVVLMLLTGIFAPSRFYAETLGTLALGIEAMMPVPQVINNFRRKSTAGLSSVLIATWVLGDGLKAVYAVIKGAPWQFLACALFQVSMDIVILIQMTALYGSAKPKTEDAAPGTPAASAGGSGLELHAVGEGVAAGAAGSEESKNWAGGAHPEQGSAVPEFGGESLLSMGAAGAAEGGPSAGAGPDNQHYDGTGTGLLTATGGAASSGSGSALGSVGALPATSPGRASSASAFSSVTTSSVRGRSVNGQPSPKGTQPTPALFAQPPQQQQQQRQRGVVKSPQLDGMESDRTDDSHSELVPLLPEGDDYSGDDAPRAGGGGGDLLRSPGSVSHRRPSQTRRVGVTPRTAEA